uniref:Uncharacterized protein n=1 Tax=Anguilla anguilla TaxID=7936 RepID=A0A0E9VYK6_ANGAN
MHFMTVARKM